MMLGGASACTVGGRIKDDSVVGSSIWMVVETFCEVGS